MTLLSCLIPPFSLMNEIFCLFLLIRWTTSLLLFAYYQVSIVFETSFRLQLTAIWVRWSQLFLWGEFRAFCFEVFSPGQNLWATTLVAGPACSFWSSLYTSPSVETALWMRRGGDIWVPIFSALLSWGRTSTLWAGGRWRKKSPNSHHTHQEFSLFNSEWGDEKLLTACSFPWDAVTLYWKRGKRRPIFLATATLIGVSVHLLWEWVGRSRLRLKSCGLLNTKPQPASSQSIPNSMDRCSNLSNLLLPNPNLSIYFPE